jgi:amino acid transporter
MASRQVLPEFLSKISPRFATPVAASVLAGLILIGLTWLYLLTTSVQGAFNDVINITGLLYAAFYILTALAAVTYYRRRILRNPWDTLVLGVLPIAATGFLVWVMVKSLQAAPAPQLWSLAGVAGVGLALMLFARFVLRSPLFQIQRESDPAGR